jgi:hypothetical protein
MCLLCVTGVNAAGDEVRRLYVLRLLALVEHPDALPHDTALRLGREILATMGAANLRFRCDSSPPDGAIGGAHDKA